MTFVTANKEIIHPLLALASVWGVTFSCNDLVMYVYGLTAEQNRKLENIENQLKN